MITIEPIIQNIISHTIDYSHDYMGPNRKNLQPAIDGLKRKQI